MYYKRAFFIKALKYRRFGNDIVQSVSIIFHGAFRSLFFYNQKSFVRRRLRRCRLRHEIHTIKTRPNNTLRFLQRKNIILHYLANDLTCAARKTTFRTRKRFHNKQYTPKSKDQPFESDRTHFDIGFNKSNVATHRPTIIFLLSHKITTVQSKTAEINNNINQPQNQSGNTITTNNHSTKYYQKQQSYQSATKTTTTINPRIRQTKTRPKQTTTNKHDKLSHQS